MHAGNKSTVTSAREMLRDAARLLADDDGFELLVYPGKGQRFEAGSENEATFYALMLKRQRQARGLSLKDVSERLGMKSRNAYARPSRDAPLPRFRSSRSS